MLFSFSANAFRKFSLEETIAAVAGAGYRAIEIMADAPHAWPPDLKASDVARIREILARHDLVVANVNAFMMHAVGDTWRPSWIERDPARRQERIEHTARSIELAATLGSRTISTEPGGPLDGMPRDEAAGLFREGLARVEGVARAKGVQVLIEPEPDLLLESSQDFLDFFPGLDPEVFGLNFDIGHFFCAGEDPAALVPLLAPYTGHYHLEDIAADRRHHHLLPGEGAIDLARVLAAIRATGYGGFVTVELYPYEEAPAATAAEALVRLRGLGF